MSRRSVPSIGPADLRDHADDVRVARVWERIEQDLPLPRSKQPSRAGGWALTLVAATAAAFGVGLFAGKAVWNAPEPAALPAIASTDRALVDVLAAGSEARTFALPGGGEVRLGPGATIEVERAAGALTLRLVQGEASVDTSRGDHATALSIVAGDARLSTAAGSAIVVRRSGDVMDVEVNDGSVAIESPDGSRRLVGGQALEVPLRELTAAVPTATAKHPAPLSRSMSARKQTEPASSVAAEADWRALLVQRDYAGAFELLNQQPGGIDGAIAAARGPGELMDISDVSRKVGDHGAATRAQERVVERFPDDPNASIAAFSLSKSYEKGGRRDLAQKYRELAGEGALAEDALCMAIQAEAGAGNKEEASRRATEYVGKYPNGRCKDDAEQILLGGDAAEGPVAPEPAPSAEADAGAP